MFGESAPGPGVEPEAMLFRCRRCGETTDDSAAMSRHVVAKHDRSTLGWDVVRVPETEAERPVAWLSNLPVRVRSGLPPRLPFRGGSDGG